jgi:hypothetical protein
VFCLFTVPAQNSGAAFGIHFLPWKQRGSDQLAAAIADQLDLGYFVVFFNNRIKSYFPSLTAFSFAIK